MMISVLLWICMPFLIWGILISDFDDLVATIIIYICASIFYFLRYIYGNIPDLHITPQIVIIGMMILYTILCRVISNQKM